MNKTQVLGVLALAVALAGAGSVNAATRHQELNNKENFTSEDAIKAQVYVNAAMTTPMAELLSKADIVRPDVMLEYGIALDLGRPSVSSQLSKEDREKLKRGFRNFANSG